MHSFNKCSVSTGTTRQAVRKTVPAVQQGTETFKKPCYKCSSCEEGVQVGARKGLPGKGHLSHDREVRREARPVAVGTACVQRDNVCARGLERSPRCWAQRRRGAWWGTQDQKIRGFGGCLKKRSLYL